MQLPLLATTAATSANAGDNDADPHMISSVKINGTNAGDFARSNGGRLAAASCSISVTFTPRDFGTRTGEIVISDSTNSGQPVVVYLSGTGQ
jgi:hypothetical protein